MKTKEDLKREVELEIRDDFSKFRESECERAFSMKEFAFKVFLISISITSIMIYAFGENRAFYISLGVLIVMTLNLLSAFHSAGKITDNLKTLDKRTQECIAYAFQEIEKQFIEHEKSQDTNNR